MGSMVWPATQGWDAPLHPLTHAPRTTHHVLYVHCYMHQLRLLQTSPVRTSGPAATVELNLIPRSGAHSSNPPSPASHLAASSRTAPHLGPSSIDRYPSQPPLPPPPSGHTQVATASSTTARLQSRHCHRLHDPSPPDDWQARPLRQPSSTSPQGTTHVLTLPTTLSLSASPQSCKDDTLAEQDQLSLLFRACHSG